MGAGESSRRIRAALRSEMDKRWGQIEAINRAIGHNREYLGKVCRGEMPIKLDELLSALEVMEIDAGHFVANALGTRVVNDSLLEEIEHFGKIPPRLLRVEKMLGELEVSEPSPEPVPEIDAPTMLAEMLRCSGKEQRRRLGNARKYRHPAFVALYLEHLDDLRYDHPKEARQNAETMALKLIPHLAVSRSERLVPMLKAVGIAASAYRQRGDYAGAARVLRRALGIARSHKLMATVGELLQRAAYVLSDNGRYQDAMSLLNEALVIFFDLKSQQQVGRIQVDRGAHFYFCGEYGTAISELQHALLALDGDSTHTRRNRLVAHQVLVHCYRSKGELERAEKAAAEAVDSFKSAGRVYQAAFLWEHGAIALQRGAFDLAEESLREASELFGELGDPNRALVALDLTEVLIARKKTLESVAMAMNAAEYLRIFRGNKITDAAITKLMHTAARGKVTLEIIKSVREQVLETSTKSNLQTR